MADAFVGSMGAGALADLLPNHLGAPTQVTAAHRAIARAASVTSSLVHSGGSRHAGTWSAVEPVDVTCL